MKEQLQTQARRQSWHTDLTLITLIPPPTDSGLEIQVNGKHSPVEIPMTACLVQAGRLLERLTNGTITASLHTVELSEQEKQRSRYSTPCFMSGEVTRIVAPLQQFIKQNNKPLFSPESIGNLQKKYFSSIFKKD